MSVTEEKATEPEEEKLAKPMRVVMKFGGSSLATADRVDYVTKLIKNQIAKGYRPMIVCSAMGKTTNNLLTSGEFALDGHVKKTTEQVIIIISPVVTLTITCQPPLYAQVYIDALRTLHLGAAKELGLDPTTIQELEDLLEDLKNLLSGISYLRELTPRTNDYLVS